MATIHQFGPQESMTEVSRSTPLRRSTPAVEVVSAGLLGLRNRHFLLLDLAASLLTPLLAVLWRFDGTLPAQQLGLSLIAVTVLFLAIKMAVFTGRGLYARYWRYASIDELGQIGGAVGLAMIAQLLVFFSIRAAGWIPADFPVAVPLLDGLLTLIAVGGPRFLVRLVERFRWLRQSSTAATPVLVVGAGAAGVAIVQEMQHNPKLGLHAVGYVDEAPEKQGAVIRGVPVLGQWSNLPELVLLHGVKQVIIALPEASGKTIREITDLCGRSGVAVRTMPGIAELLDGKVSVSKLRPVDITDLLRREPVQGDTAAVHTLLHGKRILVTGGGGSIGGELCRQVMPCGPAALYVLGHGENSVFEITNELRRWEQKHRPGQPSVVEAIVADIRFPERMQAIFARVRPEIVFHAAAHKHVPLMEDHPAEAITNNVLGTRNVLNACLMSGVERFVMLSTDKAVNPTSVMGASKRAAELLVHQAARTSGRAYVAVRFGNVLGSRGSVLHTFKQQITAGGPVTITHPEMTRFFMTIPEAVQLVLQAGVLGHGGEVFVLDMGEPVRIVDLARDVIALSGLEVGRDIDIAFSGLRPGEKLYEELFIPGEHYARTTHQKIFRGNNAGELVPSNLNDLLITLEAAAWSDDKAAIGHTLKQLVPEFQPSSLGIPRAVPALVREHAAPMLLPATPTRVLVSATA